MEKQQWLSECSGKRGLEFNRQETFSDCACRRQSGATA